MAHELEGSNVELAFLALLLHSAEASEDHASQLEEWRTRI
jgi:hypothetical protein